MAYALKYYSNFNTYQKDIAKEYRVEIYLDGYGGASSEIRLTNIPFTLQSVDSDMFTVLKKTIGTLNIWNTTEGEYSEFQTAGYADYYLKLIEDPNGTPATKWIGYNAANTITESYIAPPYVSSIKFNCGLWYLERTKFDNSGSLYTGFKTLIEVIRLCTNKLGVALSLYEVVNVYEDNMNSTASDSALAQTWVDVGVYTKLNDKQSPAVLEAWTCGEVLEAILTPFKAHIYSYDNLWFIVRVQEYNTFISDLYYRAFAANVGTESTVTVALSGTNTSTYAITGKDKGNTDELVFLNSSQELEVIPPFNRYTIKYSESTIDASAFNNLINNVWIGGYGGILWLWSETGFDSTTYTSAILHNDSIHSTPSYINKYWFTFDPTDLATSYSFNASIYISQSKTNLPLTANDDLTISLSVAIQTSITGLTAAEYNDAQSFYSFYESVIPMEIKLGSYYFVGGNTIASSWSASQGYYYMRVRHYNGNVPLGSAFNPIADSSHMHRRDLVASIPNIAATELGNADIKVFLPYSNINTFNNSHTAQIALDYYYITNLSIEYVAQGTNTTTSDVEYYTEVRDDAEIYEEEWVHADGSLSLSKNAFRVDTGGAYPVLTDIWTRRGYADNVKLAYVAIKQIRDLRADFIHGLRAELVGKINVWNTLTYIVGGTTTYYYISGFNWDVAGQKWDVELLEVANFTSIEPPIEGDATFRQLPTKQPTYEGNNTVVVDRETIQKKQISLSNGGVLVGGDDSYNFDNYL